MFPGRSLIARFLTLDSTSHGVLSVPPTSAGPPCSAPSREDTPQPVSDKSARSYLEKQHGSARNGTRQHEEIFRFIPTSVGEMDLRRRNRTQKVHGHCTTCETPFTLTFAQPVGCTPNISTPAATSNEETESKFYQLGERRCCSDGNMCTSSCANDSTASFRSLRPLNLAETADNGYHSPRPECLISVAGFMRRESSMRKQPGRLHRAPPSPNHQNPAHVFEAFPRDSMQSPTPHQASRCDPPKGDPAKPKTRKRKTLKSKISSWLKSLSLSPGNSTKKSSSPDVPQATANDDICPSSLLQMTAEDGYNDYSSLFGSPGSSFSDEEPNLMPYDPLPHSPLLLPTEYTYETPSTPFDPHLLFTTSSRLDPYISGNDDVSHLDISDISEEGNMEAQSRQKDGLQEEPRDGGGGGSCHQLLFGMDL